MTLEDLPDDVNEARAEKAKANRMVTALVRTRERELIPLWRRIQDQASTDVFGDEIEISMTRRAAS